MFARSPLGKCSLASSQSWRGVNLLQSLFTVSVFSFAFSFPFFFAGESEMLRAAPAFFSVLFLGSPPGAGGQGHSLLSQCSV